MNNRILRCLIAVAALFLTASFANAQANADPSPCSATDRANERAAMMVKAELSMVEQCAAAADAVAQNELGRRYGLGRGGVAKDSEKSFKLYEAAAAAGYAQGQANLAFMYWNGEGTEKDYEKAYRWGMLAAEAGMAQAQYQIGYMHVMGLGAPKDGRLAEKWLLAAANQGLVPAQGALRTLYMEGKLVPFDPLRAAIWQRRAKQAWRKVGPDLVALQPEDMPQLAEAFVKKLPENERGKLDYSIASLKEMDQLIGTARDTKNVMSLEEEVFVMWGAYVGQVLGRSLGLAWAMPEAANTPYGLLQYPILRANNGGSVDPVAEVRSSLLVPQNRLMAQLHAESVKKFAAKAK